MLALCYLYQGLGRAVAYTDMTSHIINTFAKRAAESSSAEAASARAVSSTEADCPFCRILRDEAECFKVLLELGKSCVVESEDMRIVLRR